MCGDGSSEQKMARGKKRQEEQLSDASGNKQTSSSPSGSMVHERPAATGVSKCPEGTQRLQFLSPEPRQAPEFPQCLERTPPRPVPGTRAHAPGWGPRGTPRMSAGQQENRGLKYTLLRATLQTSITIVIPGTIRILLAFLTLIWGFPRWH